MEAEVDRCSNLESSSQVMRQLKKTRLLLIVQRQKSHTGL